MAFVSTEAGDASWRGRLCEAIPLPRRARGRRDARVKECEREECDAGGFARRDECGDG